jgi:hypothetical protein
MVQALNSNWRGSWHLHPLRVDIMSQDSSSLMDLWECHTPLKISQSICSGFGTWAVHFGEFPSSWAMLFFNLSPYPSPCQWGTSGGDAQFWVSLCSYDVTQVSSAAPLCTFSITTHSPNSQTNHTPALDHFLRGRLTPSLQNIPLDFLNSLQPKILKQRKTYSRK